MGHDGSDISTNDSNLIETYREEYLNLEEIIKNSQTMENDSLPHHCNQPDQENNNNNNNNYNTDNNTNNNNNSDSTFDMSTKEGKRKKRMGEKERKRKKKKKSVLIPLL